MSTQRRILVLYSEAMGYVTNVFRLLHRNHGLDVHVVRWDTADQRLTPYAPAPCEGVRYYARSEYDNDSLLTLARDLSPQLVYVSGWMDRSYLRVASAQRRAGTPVIGALDNQWRGTIRQRIACGLSKRTVRKCFDFLTVPGEAQYEFARRLGFQPSRIIPYMYSANTDPYRAVYERHRDEKARDYPRRFLFAGRYSDAKGLDTLVSAFEASCRISDHDWELKLIGNGPLRDSLADRERVFVCDFMSQEELAREASHAGVFVLPSRWEPWGVVIHEFAAAGLPLLCSDACGAARTFLIDGYNGHTFDAGSISDLTNRLLDFTAWPTELLVRAGDRSAALSMRITPELTAASIVSCMNGNHPS